ncbi:MAG: hypothetical protein PHR36_01350 [Patescibacteria group bacterium]|nr:hypothetical protein [Patescibacteria group bacterium]
MAKQKQNRGGGGANAGTKTDKIRLLTGNPEKRNDRFAVAIEALVKESGVVRANCPVTFYHNNLEVIVAGVLTDAAGKATCVYEVPLDMAGKKVSIRAQIDNTADEAFCEVTFPADPAVTETIHLVSGKASEVDSRFVVNIEALVEADKKGKGGCPVTFYCDGLTILAAGVLTDANGKATCAYKAPFKKAGKKVSIRARIDGTAVEHSADIVLPVAPKIFAKAFENVWARMKFNLARKGELLIKHSAKTFMFALLAWVIIALGGVKLLGIGLGIFFFFQAVKKFAVVSGIVIALAVPVVFWIFSSQIAGTLSFAIWMVFFFGEPFYWLEELLKTIEEKEGKAVDVKVINLYPWVPMGFAIFFIMIHLFSLLGGGSGAEVSSFEDTEVLSLGGNEGGGGFFGFFHNLYRNFKDIVDWIFFIIILSVWAMPGEVLGITGFKKADMTAEKGLFLWGIFDLLGKLFLKKKGGK